MERTRVRARPLTAACVLFVCVLVSQNLGIVTAQTETLLVDSGVPPGLLSGGTGLVIFGSQFLAQQFTLPSDAVITAVEPYVGRNRALASPVVSRRSPPRSARPRCRRLCLLSSRSLQPP